MLLIFSIQQRYVVVALMFISLSIAMALRISFPIVLTQMVYVPNINENLHNSTNNEIVCPIKYNIVENSSNELLHSISINNPNRFQWSQKLQGFVLSSFYCGTIFAEIPGAILVQHYGARNTLLVSITLSAVITVITPSAVKYGTVYGLIVARILLGFVQGPIFPCLSAIAVAWYPADQRGRLCSIGYIGISAGGIFATYTSGMLMNFTQQWDIVFYFFAGILVLWWILMALLCYEEPQNHPYISNEEKTYLENKIENFERANNKLPPTPWKSILSCPPVITLIFSTALYSWSFYIVNTDLPKYLNDVLHVSIQKNTIYSSLPRILSIFVSIGSGFIGDLMTTKCNVNRTIVRKIFVILTSTVPAIFLICASYAECDELLAIIYLSISIAGHGFNSAGAGINLFDLSPNYVAPLNGIINSIATIVGISAPYIAGVLTPNAFLSEWRLVFWITFALHMTEALVFTIFGSAEVQLWNSIKPKSSVK